LNSTTHSSYFNTKIDTVYDENELDSCDFFILLNYYLPEICKSLSSLSEIYSCSFLAWEEESENDIIIN